MKLKFATLCSEGFEEYVSTEITRLLSIPKKKQEVRNSVILFEASKEDIVKYIYFTQGANKVLHVVADIEFADISDISKKVKDFDFSFINDSFAVRSNNNDAERPIGGSIYETLESPTVDLKSPIFSLYAFVKGKSCVLGLDISEIDLSKRSYKVFTHPSTIKGTLAFFLLGTAGYTGKENLLDPCMGSGTIPIEASFVASNYSPRFFEKRELFRSPFFDDLEIFDILEELDKLAEKKLDGSIQGYDIMLPAVNATKKNIKVAGVESYISVGRGDIDWLETKFEEKSVDVVVSNPPLYNNHNEKKNDKFYDIFFYQVEYVLADKGKIVVLTNSKRIIPFAEKYKIKCSAEKEFMLGVNKRYILTFMKE